MARKDIAMAKNNVARDVLWPNDKNILVRVAFLYVGQGHSAIVFVRDSDVYRVYVVDINLDSKRGGTDVPTLVKDLLDGQDLTAFVNTHPHDDHLCGTQELSDAVEITEVWHANHKPSKKYGKKHPELTALIEKVTEKYGKDSEVIINRDRTPAPSDLGEAQYQFLHPCEHLTDEVNDEDPEERYARIHEQCGVLKFGKDKTWILIVGDANKCAFVDHIMKKWKSKDLKSIVLLGSHHGSRTFFKDSEDDDPYKDALNAIDPKYVVISAPTQEESPHDHPDDDAVELYEEKVGEDNVEHTGEERYCFIYDIYSDGSHSETMTDEGQLVDAYGLADDDGDDDGGESKAYATGPFVATSPREQTGPYQPRKYG